MNRPSFALEPDYGLEAQLEHVDRLLAEAEPGGVLEAWLLDDRRVIAGELVRRSRLGYQRAAGRYDLRAILEQVDKRADLLSIFGARHACTQSALTQPNGRIVHILCPWHADRVPSLAIYRDQQRWYCYACQVGGDAVDAVMRLDSVTFIEAVLRTAREFGVECRPLPPRASRALPRTALALP